MRKLLFLLFLLPGWLSAQPVRLAELNAAAISCTDRDDGVLQISLIDGASPATFQWTRLPNSPAGSGSVSASSPIASISDLPPGAYRVSLVDANGADTIMFAIVEEPLPLSAALSIATDFNGFGVSCSGGADGQLRAQVSGGTPYYVFDWSAGNANNPLADSLEAGEHRLTVSDSRGCSLELSATLTEPAPIETQVNAVGEKCFGENSGLIELQQTTGGVAPYLASLDDEPFATQTVWPDLLPGAHFLTVEDANGCRHIDGVVLPTGFQFAFSAGSDTVLLAGDSLHVALSSANLLDTVIWTPSASVAAADAQTATLFPLFSTRYQLTAIDLSGCKAVDDLSVVVRRDRAIYAPGAFAPEGQNADNQRFTIYGGEGIRAVATLQVFDRLGRLIFENRNFPVNDPASGWDGIVDGEIALPGVFVWHAVIDFTDGREEVYQGDVFLLR